MNIWSIFLVFFIGILPSCTQGRTNISILGSTWTETTAHAQFSSRSGHSSVAFQNKMWVIGGQGENEIGVQRDLILLDIWYSSDGITWSMANVNLPFSASGVHTSVVFKGKMWVIGGFFGDIWFSTDGITWTKKTTFQYPPRFFESSVVFDNKIWIIGGEDIRGRNQNNAWYSTDGAAWTQATDQMPYSVRPIYTNLVLDNRIWVIGGGRNIVSSLNDVWYSSDGINWIQAAAQTRFPDRMFQSGVVFNNKIWVIGGV